MKIDKMESLKYRYRPFKTGCECLEWMKKRRFYPMDAKGFFYNCGVEDDAMVILINRTTNSVVRRSFREVLEEGFTVNGEPFGMEVNVEI